MKKRTRLPLTPGMKVAELVSDNPDILLMLEHFGIGPAFQDKTVEQIGKEHAVNPGLLLAFSRLFLGGDTPGTDDLGTGDLPAILQYLQVSHSYYLDEKLPGIHRLLEEMTARNGHPETDLAERFFQEYEKEINQHLSYENLTVFPYVARLADILAGKSGEETLPPFSISDYQEHHDDIEIKLNDLMNLLIKYLPVENDRRIRRELIIRLYELGGDLQVHTRIEDHVLIPIVEKLENQLGLNR